MIFSMSRYLMRQNCIQRTNRKNAQYIWRMEKALGVHGSISDDIFMMDKRHKRRRYCPKYTGPLTENRRLGMIDRKIYSKKLLPEETCEYLAWEKVIDQID